MRLEGGLGVEFGVILVGAVCLVVWVGVYFFALERVSLACVRVDGSTCLAEK